MAEYRDELAAARMRIDTLEAKLAERDAALRARDAEIMERDAELERLRATRGGEASQGRSVLATVLPVGLAIFVTLAIGFFFGTFFAIKSGGESAPAQPSPTEPLAAPLSPHPASDTPPAHAEGTAQGDDDGATTTSLSAQVDRARPEIEAKIRACYADERLHNPSATGFLSVTFDIDGMGSVSRVELGGLLGSSPPWWGDAFATCVDKAVRAQRFQPSGDSKTTAKISLHLMRPLGL